MTTPSKPVGVDTYGRHCKIDHDHFYYYFEEITRIEYRPNYVGRHRCLAFDKEIPIELRRECGGTRPHMIFFGPRYGYRLCATG